MRIVKLILCVPLLFAITVWSCAGSGGVNTKSITVPVDDNSYLVCGSILVENNWYSSGESGIVSDGRQVEEVYEKGVEIAVLGKYTDENGMEKTKGYYTTSDEKGYFYLENVPPGNYALKGFRISMNDGRYLTVFSDLDGAESAYLQRRRQEQMIIFKGDYFPFPANNRVVNLRHNVFYMANTAMCGHQTFVVIRDMGFNFSSKKHTKEPIEQYLIEKFPDNGWKMYLTASLQKNLESGY